MTNLVEDDTSETKGKRRKVKVICNEVDEEQYDTDKRPLFDGGYEKYKKINEKWMKDRV